MLHSDYVKMAVVHVSNFYVCFCEPPINHVKRSWQSGYCLAFGQTVSEISKTTWCLSGPKC